jgi:glycosyltransferase involved in cell wall biosynthesis
MTAVTKRDKKVIVVMPAYNAEKTLERTLADVPMDWVDDIILVDDASRDGTVALARRLGLRVLVHAKNRGYGGNQKTCYTEALKLGGEIMIMVHPDHQYDPTVIPQLIMPLLDTERRAGTRADAVFGSRMLGGHPMEGGMPKWKYLANVFLTALENATFYMYLTEYHSGLRAYSRRYLESVNFMANSDDFVFDSEIIAQGVLKGMRIREIPIETRYFQEASQIGLARSLVYGLSILKTLTKFKLHKKGLVKFAMFNAPAGSRTGKG